MMPAAVGLASLDLIRWGMARLRKPRVDGDGMPPQPSGHPLPPVPHVGPDALRERTLLIKPGPAFGKACEGLLRNA